MATNPIRPAARSGAHPAEWNNDIEQAEKKKPACSRSWKMDARWKVLKMPSVTARRASASHRYPAPILVHS